MKRLTEKSVRTLFFIVATIEILVITFRFGAASVSSVNIVDVSIHASRLGYKLGVKSGKLQTMFNKPCLETVDSEDITTHPRQVQ